MSGRIIAVGDMSTAAVASERAYGGVREREPMETTTLVVIAGAALVLVVAGGYFLLVRWRREQRVKAATFLHFRCPGCQRRLRFQARQTGHKGKCSHCGQDVVFPPAGQSID